MNTPDHEHTFSLVTRDRPGVLVRIALVFARRRYNIESLAVSPGAVEGFARFTITSRGSPDGVVQIEKQLAKLIDVVFVANHRNDDPIEAEIALVKLRCPPGEQARARSAIEAHGGRVVDATDGTIVVCATGSSREIGSLVEALGGYGIEELVRSGRIVMDRGRSQFSHLLRDPD